MEKLGIGIEWLIMKILYKYKIKEEGLRRGKMVEYESGLE